jgi:hypothetical protein
MMPGFVEVPPSPVVLMGTGPAQIVAQAPDGIVGRWMRFYITVYALGGQIFYRDLDSEFLEVQVYFP